MENNNKNFIKGRCICESKNRKWRLTDFTSNYSKTKYMATLVCDNCNSEWCTSYITDEIFLMFNDEQKSTLYSVLEQQKEGIETNRKWFQDIIDKALKDIRRVNANEKRINTMINYYKEIEEKQTEF